MYADMHQSPRYVYRVLDSRLLLPNDTRDDVNPYFPLTFPFRVVYVHSIGLWLRFLSLDAIEKIRDRLIAKPIDGTFDTFATAYGGILIFHEM